jgi:hypothetical protein
MEIGETKLFKKTVTTFCIVWVALQAVDFGSYYFGRYGFSAPAKADGLIWTFYQAAQTSLSGAIAAAIAVYLSGRRKKGEGKSNDAA